jgi:hypothetical protein
MTPTAVAQADSLRPLGLAWTVVLILAGVLAWVFGALTGRAVDFGPVAWALVCASPTVLGIVLACTSTSDRRQYMARGLAAAAMAPILLAMWASTPPDTPAPETSRIGTAAEWALGLGSLLVHVLAWLALLALTARAATRLRPPAGMPAVARDRLRERLAAVPAARWPVQALAIDTAPDAPWEIQLRVDDSGDRAHCVRLLADASRHTVHVTEHLGAKAAAPLPHEASFHRPGDPLADASRPPVQRVSSRIRQATMLLPEDVAAIPLAWDAQGLVGPAVMPPDWARRNPDKRGEWAVAVLAAVVLQSGWHWQPRLTALPSARGGPGAQP